MADQNPAAQPDAAADAAKEAKRKKITMIIFVVVLVVAAITIAKGLKQAGDLQVEDLNDLKAKKQSTK